MIGHSYPRLRRGRAGGITAACAAVMLSVGAVAGVAGAAVTAQKPAGPTGGQYIAEIRRTTYGMPHVLARDFGSLGYGYGYAFAQDNLCTLASQVLTLHGQRSRYFGPDADSGDPFAPATNLVSDIYYQGLWGSQVVRRLLARPAPLGPTPQARQLVDGYAAGYNRYLRDTGTAHLPDPTCRGAAWVRPITALDIWTLIYNFDQTAGIDQVKQWIATASPPSANTTTTPVTAAPAVPLGTQMGSNAIGLGRQATVGGAGMLLANPHFPWVGPSRFYQVQLTIPGKLNVAGASVYGTPVVEIGHTSHLAWTHTVSTAQRYTLYQLALVPGKPTSYLVDGRAEPMTTDTVHVTVRGAGSQLSTVTHMLYYSRYGPVLAHDWTATTAFAIRDANAGNLRSVNEWLAMDSSDNLAQLRAAQDTYQGLPFVNTIAADASGRTYFADASVVPDVTDQQAARCIDTPQGKDAYPGQFILDGSTTACQWGRDPGAIEPGIFAPGHDPHLSRSDYVTNSNDSAWLANPAHPITGYPRIFGDIGTERSLRTRLGLNMVAERLAGTDGLGPPGFTLPALQATILGDRNYSAELARAATVAMCRAHPVLPASNGQPVDVRAACDALAAWNGKGDPDSRGAVLWRQFFNTAATAGNIWRVPFDPAHPLTTPRALDTGLPAVQHALADAVAYFQAHHIPLGEPLGAAQRYAAIPVPGCTDTEGCFNIADPAAGPLSTSGVYPDVNDGSSFIMAVELTPAGPRTRTILTYSESANPASPHHTDQTTLFSHKQWVTERFTQAQVTSDPQLAITILRGQPA